MAFSKEFQDVAKSAAELLIEVHRLRSELEATKAALAAERERCAKECELVAQNWSKNNDEYKDVALMCAQQIRTGKH